MENFNIFIEEIQKFEIRVKEFYIDNDYVIEEFTVEEAPDYLLKKGFFLDLSHYNNDSSYSEKLKILQQRALTELSNLSIEQVNIHLSRIGLILSRFSKMYDKCNAVKEKFEKGNFNKVDLELEIFSAFIVEKPQNYNLASVTESFFWDLLDAITVQKDGYLQGFDKQIRDIFGIQNKEKTTYKTNSSTSENNEENLRKTLYKKFKGFHNGNAFEFPKWEFIVRATNLVEKKQSVFATLIYHVLNDLFSIESNFWFEYKSINGEDKTATVFACTHFPNEVGIKREEIIIDYNKKNDDWNYVKDKSIEKLNANPKAIPTYKYQKYIKDLLIEVWAIISTVQKNYKNDFFECIYLKTPSTSFEDYIRDENPDYEEPTAITAPSILKKKVKKTNKHDDKKMDEAIHKVNVFENIFTTRKNIDDALFELKSRRVGGFSKRTLERAIKTKFNDSKLTFENYVKRYLSDKLTDKK